MQITTNELISKYKSFFKGGGHYYSDPKKTEKKDDVKKIEDSIMLLIQNHLPAHTTKGELIKSLNKRKG